MLEKVYTDVFNHFGADFLQQNHNVSVLLRIYDVYLQICMRYYVYVPDRDNMQRLRRAEKIVNELLSKYVYSQGEIMPIVDEVKDIPSPMAGVKVIGKDISLLSVAGLGSYVGIIDIANDRIKDGWTLDEVKMIYSELEQEDLDSGKDKIMEELKFRRGKEKRLKEADLRSRIEALKSREEQRADLEGQLADLLKE